MTIVLEKVSKEELNRCIRAEETFALMKRSDEEHRKLKKKIWMKQGCKSKGHLRNWRCELIGRVGIHKIEDIHKILKGR